MSSLLINFWVTGVELSRNGKVQNLCLKIKYYFYMFSLRKESFWWGCEGYYFI